MANYRNSRVIPVILVIIIVIVAIAALVSLTRAVFFSGNIQTVSDADVSKTALQSTTIDRAVRMTVRGPIVADEEFNSYQITATPSSRTLTIYTGYLDKPVDGVALGNNIPAYEEFVFALDRANLVKGIELSGDQNDIRGICATGSVYQFEVLNDNKSVKNLWTSTCKDARGSLDAKVNQLKSLFTKQIPDADAMIRKIDL